MQVYRGPVCTCHLTGLHPDTEYSVRVCGMRITDGSGDEVVGIPSTETVFKTLPLRPVNLHGDGSVGSSRGRSAGASNGGGLLLSRWSDQQCAVVLLLVFALCALLTAFLAQQVVMYSADEAAPVSMHDPASHTNVRHPNVH